MLRRKHNFFFKKNGYNKKYNKQTKTPGEREPKSLKDRRIKTIELQDVIILVADIMLLAVLSTFGRLSPSTINVVTN